MFNTFVYIVVAFLSFSCSISFHLTQRPPPPQTRGPALSIWLHIAHPYTCLSAFFKKEHVLLAAIAELVVTHWPGPAMTPLVSCDKHRSSMWRLQSCLLPLHLLHQAWRMLQTGVMMTASCMCFRWTPTEETRLYFSTAEPVGLNH